MVPGASEQALTIVVSDHNHRTRENLDVGSRSVGHHQAPVVQPRRFALWLVVQPEQEA